MRASGRCRFLLGSASGTSARRRPQTKGRAFVEISGFFTAIVIGLIIGALGRLVVPGRQNISILLTIAVGVVAALLGTLVAGIFGVAETRGIDWIEILLQIVFAAIGVAILSGVTGRRRVG